MSNMVHFKEGHLKKSAVQVGGLFQVETLTLNPYAGPMDQGGPEA